MLVARTDRFAAAVSGAGISNWISDYGTADIPRTKESEFYGPPWQTRSAELLWEASPIRHAADVSTPTLFLHGEQDFRVPIEQAEQMYTALRKQEVPARFVRYASASHGRWTPADRAHYLLETLDWWQRWLEED
jgi:dipeptidyl aminopeptidase/acylaminoacyl peptidase